jgi:hypothetical protein
MERTAERLGITWEKDGAFEPPYEHIELTLNGLKRAPQAILADGEPFGVITADPVRRTALAGVPKFERLEIVL